MRASKFNYIVENGNENIIYNFLTTSFIVLDKVNFELFCNKKYDEMENTSTLVKGGILQEDDHKEEEYYKQIIKRDKKLKNEPFNEIVIFTTTACNAQCYYCYEHNLLPISMNKETMEATVQFIVENCKDKKIKIRWFGGEPLVNVTAIDYICRRLKENEIKITSTMVTNGFLFDEEIIQKAKKEWNVRSLQITLDGIEDDYNRIKNYKIVDGSPFKKVIKNIHRLINHDIRVSLRINYSVDNIEGAKRIIDYLANEFLDKDKLYVYCAFVREVGKRCISDFDSKSSPQLVLLEYLFKKGFIKDINRLLPRVRVFPCEAWFPHRYFIYPNGDIYKCQHTTSDNLYRAVGNVNQRTINKEVLKEWEFKSLPDKCEGCKMVTICQGGCVSIRMQNLFPNADCYEYKNSFDGLLKLYYKFYKEVEKDGSCSISRN